MRNCLFCKKETKNKKFCSIKCRSKYIKANSKKVVICEICGKKFKVYKKSTKRFCSRQCRNKYMKTDEWKNKMLESLKETTKNRYGVEYYSYSPDFKAKLKKTKLERYGDENYVNPKKAAETRLKKYGSKNAFQYRSKEFNLRMKERYDDENYNNRARFKETMLSEYGGIGLQRKNVRKSAVDGLIKKYGINTSLKDAEVCKKIENTMIKKYGCKTYWGSDKAKEAEYQKKIKKIIPILKEQNIFLIDEYKGSKYMDDRDTLHYLYYNFICKECNTKFVDHFANGKIPACPSCNYIPKKRSKIEEEFAEFLYRIIKDTVLRRNVKNIIEGRELDFYLPGKKIAIELDGNFWHSEIKGNKSKFYHLDKTKACEERGIQLIHIFEDEWMYKRSIVKSRLSHILNLNSKKIYARKCTIKLITPREKNNFLESYHIQGADKSNIKIALFYNDEIVAVMTFGKLRRALGYKNTDNNTYELIRFATKYTIVGGASRLLSYFIRNYGPKKIISYADRRWSVGNLYKTLKFTEVSSGAPNYWYVNRKNYLSRIHRFTFRKNVLNEKLKDFRSELTEWENMQLNNYDRIWDCGSLKYELAL